VNGSPSLHPSDWMIAATKLLAKLLSDRVIRKQRTAFWQKNEMQSEKTDDKLSVRTRNPADSRRYSA